MSVRPIILAHGDLDGMVSGILVTQARGTETEIVITSGRTLARTLWQLARRTTPVAEVYAVDVPLEADARKSVLAAIQRLADLGISVSIFDHHVGWDDPAVADLERSCDRFVIDTSKTTAAAIVFRELSRGAKGAARWLQLVSERDRSDDPGIRSDFRVLVALRQRKNWHLTEHVLNALALGKPLDSRTRTSLESDFAEQRAAEGAIADKAVVMQTAGGRRIAWVDARGQEFRPFLARDVIARHRVELVATVTEKGVILGQESIDEGIDLTFLHGTHEHLGVRFAVVGHRSPVRFRPADGVVSEPFLSAMREVIAHRL